MRETILENGGEIHFNSLLTDIEVVNNRLKAIIINKTKHVPVSHLILAAGHSARDVYRILHRHGLALEPKPFALGVRVEHPQHLINSIQYHSKTYEEILPAAQYKLVSQVNGRGVFSFCMCPGGIIVPSATEQNQIVVNGMSNSKRNSPFANSGIVAQVFPEDVKGYDKKNPLFMLDFQEAIERNCMLGNNPSQKAPVQRLTDFCTGKLSSTLPQHSYNPGAVSVDVGGLLPDFVSAALKEAFKEFDKKMKGFYTSEALVFAVESRTSSPVRVPRNLDTFQHEQALGLYPCGEGAGYAGGITSSAIDGINVAEAIIQSI